MKCYSLYLVCLLGYASAYGQEASKFRPDFYTLQYAGSIGTVSVGTGCDLWKGKGLISIHYGYVPSVLGGDLHIAATKFTYQPWTLNLNSSSQLHLFNFGAMISYHFGEQFHTRWPSHRYPPDYYWWRPSLRAHLLIENSIDINLNSGPFKVITAYLEANSNELYIASYFQNLKTLRLWDVFKLGVGVRVHFRSRND